MSILFLKKKTNKQNNKKNEITEVYLSWQKVRFVTLSVITAVFLNSSMWLKWFFKMAFVMGKKTNENGLGGSPPFSYLNWEVSTDNKEFKRKTMAAVGGISNFKKNWLK